MSETPRRDLEMGHQAITPQMDMGDGPRGEDHMTEQGPVTVIDVDAAEAAALEPVEDINRWCVMPAALDERWAKMDEFLRALEDFTVIRAALLDTPTTLANHPGSFYSCLHHGMDIARSRVSVLLDEMVDYGNGREAGLAEKP